MKLITRTWRKLNSVHDSNWIHKAQYDVMTIDQLTKSRSQPRIREQNHKEISHGLDFLQDSAWLINLELETLYDKKQKLSPKFLLVSVFFFFSLV